MGVLGVVFTDQLKHYLIYLQHCSTGCVQTDTQGGERERERESVCVCVCVCKTPTAIYTCLKGGEKKKGSMRGRKGGREEKITLTKMSSQADVEDYR